MTPRLLPLLAVAASAVSFVPAAHAATITYSGDTLTYTGDGSEVNDVIASAGSAGYVKFYEYQGATINGPGGVCQPAGDGLECQTPKTLKVDLGGGSDTFSLFSDFPKTTAVQLSGGDGDDILKDDYSADMGRSFDGGAGNDTIEGYKGADTLIGGPGDDTLKGGAGPDTVKGDDGNDTLEGDKYEAPAADVIDGGGGFDIIDEYADPSKDVNPPASVTQDGVADDGRPGENDNVTNVEKITAHVSGVYNGTEGADDIWVWSNVTGGDSTINGLGGNDKLSGNDQSETIDGGAGDDTIQAGYGNDTIVGGPGKDKINSDGGSYCGIYECNVPFGDDTVDARDGEVDQVECGIGNDAVKADAIDQVAPSCETVEIGAPAPGPGPGTDPDPGAGPGQPGRPAVTLVGKPTRKAVSFKVRCSAACTVSGSLRKGAKVVGKGKRTLLAPGTATVKVKVTKRLRKRTKLTLKVTVAGPSGTQTATRKVTV